MDLKIFFKELSRAVLCMTPQYKKELRLHQRPFMDKDLENAVRRAIKDVPFYKGYEKYIGDDSFDITRFPIIRKTDILDRTEEMISDRCFKKLMVPKKTGGSTGVSLQLYYSLSTLIRKNVVLNNTLAILSRNPKIAVLRGNTIPGNKIWTKIGRHDIMLSSYHIGEDTLDQYIDALRNNNINIIEAYPSSLSILARHIKRKYGTCDLPDLAGFVVSSEVFNTEARALVASVFPKTKIIDLYGHNELAAFAVSVNGEPYRFNHHYGYVEFIPTGETVNGHRIAEIVATSVLNRSMPFIRYATDDYVELDDAGRPVAILGRTSDYVVNKKGELVPCIVATRSVSMNNLTNFQYYQPAAGKLTFRVVPMDGFGDKDIKNLLEDFDNSFRGLMDCNIECVSEIPRTKIGKQMRLVQDIDLKEYS